MALGTCIHQSYELVKLLCASHPDSPLMGESTQHFSRLIRERVFIDHIETVIFNRERTSALDNGENLGLDFPQ